MYKFALLFLATGSVTAFADLKKNVKESVDNSPAVFHDEESMKNVSALGRERRAIMCPPQCFGSCSSNQQCMQYSPSMVCVQACCCPIPIDLTTACDGAPAVAMCINGLCGQGWFCTARNFCCRCQTGAAAGPCVNGICPTGYACNTNNYCCPLGSGSVIGPCVNGACPAGYICGAGNLCYSIV